MISDHRLSVLESDQGLYKQTSQKPIPVTHEIIWEYGKKCSSKLKVNYSSLHMLWTVAMCFESLFQNEGFMKHMHIGESDNATIHNHKT